MRHPTKHLRLFLASLVAAGLLAVLAGPAVHAGQHNAPPGLARAIAAQELYTADLMAIPGVVGTAVGRSANGDPVVKIYTAAGGIAGLPGTLDGVGVRVEVTGEFFALRHNEDHQPGQGGGPGNGNGNGDEVDNTVRFDRPVPIGVSSGNVESIQIVFPFLTCTVGTLGARLTDGTNFYALSNNHIYALENNASIDSDIVQPGPADAGCENNSGADPGGDTIGDLAAFVAIDFNDEASNEVDAAIASTTTDDVGTATPDVVGYGTPSSTLFVCVDCIGQPVQKYGRTTGLTKGTISAVNATVTIGFSSGPAQFVGQIVVDVSGKGKFLKSGDSGSLLVTDPGKLPVGLMFAGPRSGKMGFANPIGDVLSELALDLQARQGGGLPTLTVDGE